MQLALGGEVSVDGSFVQIGVFGYRPDRQLPPVPDGQIVDQLGPGRNDALPGLGDALATQGESYRRLGAEVGSLKVTPNYTSDLLRRR